MVFLLLSLILPCKISPADTAAKAGHAGSHRASTVDLSLSDTSLPGGKVAAKQDSSSHRIKAFFHVQIPKEWFSGDSSLTEIFFIPEGIFASVRQGSDSAQRWQSSKGFAQEPVITYYKIRDGVIVDVSFHFFPDFESGLNQASFQGLFSEELINAEKNSKTAGLIPEINLPINFPAPIAGVIGQGGKLDLTGSQRIEFGGSRVDNLDYKPTEYSQSSWFPQLEMQQHLIMNLKGTIGEKINVFIDHDSQRELDLANTIRLEYNGNEDEVIQSIKAGNTDLSLPGIVLIGGPTPHKGLFGIKSEAKLGPVNLTGIASREETQNAAQNWTGGGTTQREMKIDDYDFIKSRFFIIAPPAYVRSLTNPYDITSGNPKLLPQQIIAFKVYHGSNDPNFIRTHPEARKGNIVDIPIKGYHSSLDSTQLELILENNDDIQNPFYLLDTVGIGTTQRFTQLELSNSLPDVDILAVQWIYKDWLNKIDTIGFVDTTRAFPIDLIQTIKRDRSKPEEDTSNVSWWYELKNCYSLGGTNISAQGLDIDVFRYPQGEGQALNYDPNTGRIFAQLLGLKDASNNLKSVFDAARGLIIFPLQFPFTDSGLPVKDSIYTTPLWQPDKIPNNYYIDVKYSGTTRQYVIGTMGIIEGSEVIKIDGVILTKGTDYLINYQTGELTFLTPKADNPNAKITADFQYVPLFQANAQNLFAMRGESKIGEQGDVSSALMYYSTSSSDFRPTLGSEPKKILLGEAVGSWAAQPEIITTAIDKLPLIDTQEPSSVSISGNAGFSLPDPNSQNEVYLDDMEGAKSSTTLGISRENWEFGSAPTGMDESEFAQVLWYNLRNGVPAYELYPDLPSSTRNEQKQVMELAWRDDAWRCVAGQTKYWASLLDCVSQTGIDFSESAYLEVWVKTSGATTGSTLHIDIGTDIPEDGMRRGVDGQLKGRGVLDTEDKDHNGQLDAGEDVGLDGVAGKDGTNVVGDEGNDDYHYDTSHPDDYSGTDGTENNGHLDTEDLLGTGILDVQGNYFTTDINLASPVSDEHFVLQRSNGWSLFRIPLKDFQKNNSAQWECIKLTRMWIDNVSKGEVIDIAALDMVGNHWKHTGSDGVKLSVKNTQEDLDYTPPPITLQKDAYGNPEKEQSLVINYDSLAKSFGGGYTSYTTARNFMQYNDISFWLKAKLGGYPAQFFIRFGTNTSNYYEYRANSSASWQDVSLDLEKFAQSKLKEKPEDTLYIDGNYRIIGKPSLTNIMRIDVGVVNDSAKQLQGEIWVDELRLTAPRRDVGMATNVTFTTKLADLANFSISYGSNNPYFQSLGTFVGNTVPTENSLRNYTVNGTVALNKVFPASWKVSLPLSGALTSSSSSPKYQTGSDIILDNAESAQQSSSSLQRSFGVNFSRSGSVNPLLKLTLDNIKLAFNYADAHTNTWTSMDSSLSEQGAIGYSYSPTLPALKIGKLALSYLPQTITANLSQGYTRDRGYQMAEKQVWQVDTLGSLRDSSGKIIWMVDTLGYTYKMDTTFMKTLPTKGLNYGYGTTYKPISILQMGYTTGFAEDLLMPRKDKETGMNEAANIGLTPNLFGYITPTATYSSNYQESHTLQLDSVRDVGTTNTLALGLPVYLGKFVRILTSLRNRKEDSTATMFSPRWLLIKTEKLTDMLQVPQLTNTVSRSNQDYSLYGRPDFDYRFGLRDNPSVSLIPDARDNTQVTRSYGISNVGLQVGNVSVTSSANLSTSESGRGGQQTISEQTTYPSLLLSFSALEKYIKTFSSLSLGVNFSTDHSKAGQKTSDSTLYTSFGQNQVYGLNLSSSLKNGARAAFTTDYAKGRNESVGVTGSVTETGKADYSLTASQSFKPPAGMKLPFTSSTKVTNTIDGSLTLTFSTNTSKNVTLNTKTQDSKSLNVTPQISYNFSSSITGGANATYSQQWSTVGIGGNTRNVGMKVFVELTF